MSKKRVLVVIPAYNESENIKKNLDLVYKTLKDNMGKYSWKIVLAENGSKDNTYNVAKNYAKGKKEIVVTHFDIGSKDNAIIETWVNNKSEIYVFTDADNSAHPKFIRDLCDKIDSGYDIAAGYRFHSRENSRGFYREFISRVYNRIILPIILPTSTEDTQCGIKAVNEKVVRNIVPKLKKQNGFFDTELLAVATYKKMKICKVNVSWKETRASVLNVNKNIPNFLKNIFIIRSKIRKGYYG